MKFTKKNKSKVDSDIVRSTANSIANGGLSGSVSTSLEMHNIWGQPFNGTQDVQGDLINVASITATGNIQTDEDFVIKTLDSEGNELDGKDLNISSDGDDANFTGKENYVFDGKINGDSLEVTNDVSVGGSETISGNLKVSQKLNVSGDTTLVDVKSNKITNKGDIITDNFTASGNSKLNNVTSNNITNTDTIKTKNLEVTGSAHFFELIIDKIKSAGGAVMFTPADGFVVDIVLRDKLGPYKLLWQCQDGNGKQRDNMWKVNDQALCMSFNGAKVGTSHDVSNKYYWVVVTAVSDNENPELIDGEYYNWIELSTYLYDGDVSPEKGDNIVMCGYRGTDDPSRQSAIYISAYKSLDKGLTAPVFSQYRGINNFDLESHRQSYFDVSGAKFVGNFEVSSGQSVEDYINSKINGAESGTPYIGSNGNWYVWDKDSKSYKDSGVKAKGQDGLNGKDGTNGKDGLNGKDGTNGKDGQTGAGNKVAYKISSNTDIPVKPFITNPDLLTDGWSFDRPKEPVNPKKVHQVYNTGLVTWTTESGWCEYTEYSLESNTNVVLRHWIKSPKISSNMVSYTKVEFITTISNQEIQFNIKSFSTKDYDFIWIGDVDDSTIPTYNKDILLNNNKAVSGSNGYQNISNTITTPGQHFVYVAYGKGGGGSDPNDFGLFRIDSLMWDESSAFGHSFASPDIHNNQLTYALFKFNTTTDNQEVQFNILFGMNLYVWVSNVDDTTTPVFDLNTIENSTRSIKPGGESSKIITDIIPNAGEHQIYVACYMKDLSETETRGAYFNFEDICKNKALYESTATIEGDVITSWTDPYQSVNYDKSFDIITVDESNFVNDNGELTCKDSYIIYDNLGGVKTEVYDTNFVYLNNISPYNIFRPYSNGVYIVYRETYKDIGTPDTFRILILDDNLGYSKVIMNKVIPILYLASASFVIDQQQKLISSKIYDAEINISDLQSDVTTITNKVSSITQKADSIELTVNQHTTDIDSINNKVTKNKDDIASLTVEANAIHSEVRESISEIKGDVQTNTNNISDITLRADSIETKVSSIETRIDNISGGSTTETDISELKQRADSIESTVKKHTETISDLDGRVTTNTDNISKIKQTADSISSTVESLGDTYVSKSELSQTSDLILALVNNTYIKIGDTNITIGGDTKIDGSLTLTDDDQGFKLIGATGVTEISPKSIGTYNEFKSSNTGLQNFNKFVNSNGSQRYDNVDVIDFAGSLVIMLGDRKKGDYVSFKFTTLSSNVTNAYNSSTSTFTRLYAITPTFNATIRDDNNQTILNDFRKIDLNKEYSYTFEADTPNARILLYFTGNTSYNTWKSGYPTSGQLQPMPMPNAKFSVAGTANLPTDAHMLIGYDGWGVNFGNNKTVYCGSDGFIASFGDNIFKITSDGIIGNNRRHAAILSKENYNSDSIIYKATTEIDTIIALANEVHITFPTDPYDGYELKIYDKTKNSSGTCYITTSPYKLVFCREWEGEVKTNLELDRFCVRTYTFFSGQWYEGYEGY